MDHQDHVELLRGGIPGPGGTWADMGSGAGAFTLALADLIGPTGQIYSIDRDGDALKRQEQAMRSRFPEVLVHYLQSDFARRVEMTSLDGVVMANSLHFHREKNSIVKLIRSYLNPDGRMILVEYNVDRGNPWVPHPISYPSWEALAWEAGFGRTRLLATHPSRFLREIYSAVSW